MSIRNFIFKQTVHGPAMTRSFGVLLLTLAAALAVCFFVRAHYLRDATENIAASLQTINAYKAEEIVSWVGQQERESARLSRHPFLGELIAQELARPGSRRAQLKTWLSDHTTQKGYFAMAFLSTRGDVIVATPDYVPGTERTFKKAFGQAVKAGKPLLTDLYLDARNRPRIAMFSPISANGKGGPALCVLGIVIDPHTDFYPLVRAAPLLFAKAETLLVRKEGASVLFLNELDHREGAALKFSLPLSTPLLPAAEALKGRTGYFEGFDYRGKEVFSAVRPIPRTPWGLVTKIERREVLAPVNAQIYLRLALILLAALILYVAFYAVLLARERAARERIENAEAALHMSEQIFREFMEHSPIYVFFKDEKIRPLHLSRNYEKMIGRPLEELLGRSMDEIFPSDLSRKIVADDLKVLKEGKEVTLEEEFNGRFYTTIKFPITLKGKPTYLAGYTIDITERKLAEEALRKSEEKYRAIFEESFDGLFLTSPDGKILDMNKKGISMFGYVAKEEVLKLELKRDVYVDPQDRDRILSMVNAKGAAEYEVEVKKKSGEHMLTHCALTAVKDGAGRLMFYRGIIRDITDAKRAEQERTAHIRFLEDMDKINRSILSATDLEKMMGNILNTVLKIFDCDRVWLFYPCDPDAPSFRVPMEVTKPEYPGAKVLNVDLPMPPDMAKDLREALDSDGPRTYTAGTASPINKETAEHFGVKSQMVTALYPKRGKPWAFGLHQCSHARVWTREEIRLLQEIGRRLTDALTSLVSIRDLRESEQRLREAQRLAKIGNWEWDAAADTLKWSAEYYRIYGLDPSQRPPGYSEHLKAYTRESAALLDTAVKRNMETGEPYQLDLELAAKDAPSRWITARSETIRDRSGKITGLRGTAQDITERKLAELRIETLNREMADKNQEMENFLYITTHDLRSPLVNIQGFSQSLAGYLAEFQKMLGDVRVFAPKNDARVRELALAKVPEALDFILVSSRKMDVLITALLKVSRAGRIEMKPENVEMGELLRKVLDAMRFQLQEAGAAVKTGALPPCKADPGAVSQLFTNLLDNAVKYRDESRKLEVQVTGELRGGRVVYRISDNGSGIPEKDLDRIWNVFYRHERSGRKNGEGIGLPMVRRLVEKNGGGIRAESREGQGTVFYVELPTAEEV
ncbi:MAG: PAS domain S-box protein [Elusimicrobia bacterium]|nr:PAS domain S-box protein [Elusimicrobiota bacterium]